MIRKRIFFSVPLVLLGILLIGCQQEREEETGYDATTAAPEGVIVSVGDSLTAGYGIAAEKSYPALLEQRLQALGYNYRVINSGVSGETSSGALSRLQWVLTLKPDIVILETGANDGLRGISHDVVRDNIARMLQTLKEQDVTVVLTGMKMVLNLGPLYTRKFNKVYPELAHDYDVIFMPFFLEGVAGNKQLNISDGIHPNEAGYVRIVENLSPYVIEAIEKRQRL